MNNITPVCGFKDSEGRFWETERLALESNKNRNRVKEEERLKELVRSLFIKMFPSLVSEHRTPYGYHEAIISMQDAMLKNPDKFLKVLWEIIRYNFKQKWNA